MQRFRNDFIDAELVERAQDVKEADGGFGQLAVAGAEHHDLFPVGEIEVAVFFFAAVTHEGVAFAFLGDEVGRTFEQAQRCFRRVM